VALLAAEDQGYFAREGLAVESHLTRGSVEQIRGLLAGDFDVAHTAADNVMAYVDREGADLFVFAVVDLGVGQTLVVRPEIASFDDLRGKPLAVDALDTGYAFVLRRMLEKNGLNWGSYELMAVGSTPQRVQALQDGRAVGALLSSPAEGLRVLAPASDYFPLYPGLTAAATRRWAKDHASELVGYTRALLAGAGSVLSQERVMASLDVVRQLRQDMTGVTASLDRYVDLSYMEAAVG
jgi:ABC-type nitrate/sulfonate/bicarbonate transport system substrate-binding protein